MDGGDAVIRPRDSNFADATLTVLRGYGGIFWDTLGTSASASSQFVMFWDVLGYKALAPLNQRVQGSSP
jgi:hypothetical protein